MVQVGSSIFVVLESEIAAVLPLVGVAPAILREAAQVGEQARDRCTQNHPPSAPGFWAWSEWVRALRDLLVPLGWSRSDDDNLSTTVSPDGRVAISASSGGAGTGVATFTPTTKHPKGNATRDAITANQLSLGFVPGVIELRKSRGPVTWVLLVDRRPGPGSADYIYTELSRPGSITDAGFIASWQTRYILPPIDFSGPPERGKADDTEEGDELDVPVRRR